MRTVTWALIGSTVFGVVRLALARTEEIVVAPGQLDYFPFRTSRCCGGGRSDPCEEVIGEAGSGADEVDTEASEQRNSLEKTIKLKQEH